MTSPWFYQNRTMSHAKPLFIQWTGMKLVHSVFALPENRPTKHQIDFLLDILGYCSFRHFEKKVRMLLLLLIFCCVCPAMGSKINRNKLFPEYGINFRYISEIKNGLDRVSVVTSVPLPRFKDIHISPLKFHNCSMDMDLNSAISKEHRHLQIMVSEWCAKATPYMQHLRKKEKYFVDRLHGLLENDLYSILPQLRSGSQVICP